MERLHDLAHGPVDLHHHVAIKSRAGFALEFLAGPDGHVRHVVRDVQQEMVVFVPLDEVDGVLGVPGGEHRLVLLSDAIDFDLAVFPELQRILAQSGFGSPGWNSHMSFEYMRPHDSVESAGRRPRIGLIADVPFAEHRGAISGRLEDLADGGVLRIEPAGTRRMCAEDLRPARIAPAQQRGAGGRANGLRDVEVVKLAALAGQSLDIRRLIGWIPERMEIRPARVIEENQDEVRTLRPLGRLHDPCQRRRCCCFIQQRDRLRACVEPFSREPSIGVFVVDNASNDDSVSVVADLPVSVFALKKNLGFAGGCNVGWRAAKATYVLFLNPDARVAPLGVLRLANVIERTSAGAVAPKIVNESGDLEWSVRRFPTVRSIYGQALFAHHLFPTASWVDEVIRDRERYEHEGPCDWASGACLLARRELLERIGGFDERFFLYREDVDLCRRLRNLGEAVVYTPTVVCIHAGGASAPRWRLLQLLTSSRITYARKHFGSIRAGAYRIGVALNALTHLLAGRGFHRRLGHACAFLAAIGLNVQI